MSFFKRLFVGGQWSVAYRPISGNCFKNVCQNKGEWLADPFLFEKDDKHYLFAEVFNKKKNKASIGYYEYDGIDFRYKGIVIDEKCHLSYPMVFAYKNDIYMIPESSGLKSIRLYKADVFPSKWSFVDTLLNGEKFVDNTILIKDNNYYLFTYVIERHLFTLKMYQLFFEKDTCSLIFLSEKKYSQNIARPAGHFVIDGTKLIRPAQDCSIKYGDKILMYDFFINQNSNGGLIFDEKVLYEIDTNTLGLQADRLHTFNKDSTFEVVDLFTEKIDFLRPIKLFLRKIKK